MVDRATRPRGSLSGWHRSWFSFPIDYFKRYKLKSWDQFLSDFCRHWPTDQKGIQVDMVRSGIDGESPKRSGSNCEFRLVETWSSSAKSVFQFDVQGSVAKSTHAGLPWLLRIRNALGKHTHFWPFDGWIPPTGKSVVAEIYPSIFRNRYPRSDRTCDQQDAYSVARWLNHVSRHGFLERYFDPPLTTFERKRAGLGRMDLGNPLAHSLKANASSCCWPPSCKSQRHARFFGRYALTVIGLNIPKAGAGFRF